MPESPHSEPPSFDVAVVGGGISGVYSAWRLAAESGRRVALFELSERIGGRIESAIPDGMPSVRAELGAMRFCTASVQPIVASLIGHLGLDVQPFPCSSLRKLYLRRQFVPPMPPPYHVTDREAGKSPVELFAGALKRVLPDAFELTPAQLAEALSHTRFAGRPLHQHGFWNLLLDLLSSEAYQFIFDSYGVESAFSNWNAEAAIDLLVTIMSAAWHNPDRTSFYTLPDGLSTLPLTLARRFHELGGAIYPRHKLITFKAVDLDGERGVELVFDAGGDHHRVRARALILALPSRALELIDRDAVIWCNPAWPRLLRSVTGEQAFRLYLGYDRAWWKALGWQTGYSATTLPLKSVYYWGIEHTAAGDGPALLMASYSDATSVDFWRPLQNERWFEGRPALLARELDNPPLPPLPSNAPHDMVITAQAQLAELHAAEIPEPYLASYRNWSADPYGGGWHAWKPGLRIAETIQQIRYPLARVPLPVYVCGEAFSSMQGWIEGALRSAEHVLRERFDLPPPAWLPAGAYIGP